MKHLSLLAFVALAVLAINVKTASAQAGTNGTSGPVCDNMCLNLGFGFGCVHMPGIGFRDCIATIERCRHTECTVITYISTGGTFLAAGSPCSPEDPRTDGVILSTDVTRRTAALGLEEPSSVAASDSSS